ncbi:MAG: response regulator transcription factor [Bacteroidetes bacterium]|nr:response regulator transcription factor [Bacteroidota bacterium]
MSIRVLLADDHRLMREALQSVLEKELHIKVVGLAGNGREAVDMTAELKPDVVVMDVHMPVLNGIDATREIAAASPETRIIALSMSNDSLYIAEMFRAGAHGYVIKHAAIHELENAIRTVVTGRRYVSGEVTDVVIDDYLRHLESDVHGPIDSLTPKERQVLQLISEGHSTKEIADLVCVSVSTVETHRRHLMNKLGAHSVADLTKHAIRMGLTQL